MKVKTRGIRNHQRNPKPKRRLELELIAEGLSRLNLCFGGYIQ